MQSEVFKNHHKLKLERKNGVVKQTTLVGVFTIFSLCSLSEIESTK